MATNSENDVWTVIFDDRMKDKTVQKDERLAGSLRLSFGIPQTFEAPLILRKSGVDDRGNTWFNPANSCLLGQFPPEAAGGDGLHPDTLWTPHAHGPHLYALFESSLQFPLPTMGDPEGTDKCFLEEVLNMTCAVLAYDATTNKYFSLYAIHAEGQREWYQQMEVAATNPEKNTMTEAQKIPGVSEAMNYIAFLTGGFPVRAVSAFSTNATASTPVEMLYYSRENCNSIMGWGEKSPYQCDM